MGLKEELLSIIEQLLANYAKVHIAAVAPGANDDAPTYKQGDLWLDTVTHTFYVCEDSTNGAAVWRSEVLT